jgi:integrase
LLSIYNTLTSTIYERIEKKLTANLALIPTKRSTFGTTKTDNMSKTTPKTLSPPTLYSDSEAWSIAFYQLQDNKKTRVRLTFDLNRIKDLVHRAQRAKYCLRLLDTWAISEGYPHTATCADAVLNDAPVDGWLLGEALGYACDLKRLASDRERSYQTFESYERIFVESFLHQMDWLNKKLLDFTRRDAQLFMDWLTERGDGKGKRLSGRTLNNYREGLRSLFYELMRRELIEKNPFAGLLAALEEDPIRRPLTKTERTTIINALYSHNPFLLLGVLFQFYCAVRPNEARFIKVKMLNLNENLLSLPPQNTKMRKRGEITIPQPFADILRGYGIDQLDPEWYLFGHKIEPHPTTPIGRNTLSRLHREIIRKLHAQGILLNIEGIQYYSWKDTGAMDLEEAGININDIRRHLRHENLAYTQKYLEKKQGVIAPIRDRDSGMVNASITAQTFENWKNRKNSLSKN